MKKLFKDADNWLSSLRIHQIIFIIALSLAVTILWLYGFFTTLNSDYSGMSRVDIKEYVGTYYEYKDGKPAKALTLSNQNGKEAEMTVTDLTNGSTEHWSTDKFGHMNALTDYYIGSFSDENDTKGAFLTLVKKMAKISLIYIGPMLPNILSNKDIGRKVHAKNVHLF